MWDAAELFVPEEQETEQAKFQYAVNLRLLEHSTTNTIQTQWDSIQALYTIWVKNNQLGVIAHQRGETIGDETIQNLNYMYEHIQRDINIMMRNASKASTNLNVPGIEIYGQMGNYFLKYMELDRDTFLILMGREVPEGLEQEDTGR